MHKVFYASGFLYHPATSQILLQQTNAQDNTSLSLFRGKCRRTENAVTGFQRIIQKALHIKIPLHSIHPIYDYQHSEFKEDYFINYAVVGDTAMKKLQKRNGVKWLPLKQLSKLKLTDQTRQDIVVGQRVINLAQRQKFEKDSQEKPNQPT